MIFLYKNRHEKKYLYILKEIKKNKVYEELVNGNSIPRLIINGSLNTDNLKNQIIEELQELKKIKKKIKDSDYEKKIEENKKKIISLKEENKDINFSIDTSLKELNNLLGKQNMILETDINHGPERLIQAYSGMLDHVINNY